MSRQYDCSEQHTTNNTDDPNRVICVALLDGLLGLVLLDITGCQLLALSQGGRGEAFGDEVSIFYRIRITIGGS